MNLFETEIIKRTAFKYFNIRSQNVSNVGSDISPRLLTYRDQSNGSFLTDFSRQFAHPHES
jgi:hypothetical protein